MVTNSFGNRNFMQPMEGPIVHSQCLAFFSFKFSEEGRGAGKNLFSFFFGSQCVPKHVHCSTSLLFLAIGRTLGFKNFKHARNHLSNHRFFHKNCLFLDVLKNQQLSEFFFPQNTETDISLILKIL
jgi:hypothetical protein